jgi:hypothetical protein
MAATGNSNDFDLQLGRCISDAFSILLEMNQSETRIACGGHVC